MQQQLTHLLTSKGSALASGVLGAGAFVLSAASSAVIVVVLVIYFLADLPRIKLFGYRLAPHSRRARVILLDLIPVIGSTIGGVVVTLVALPVSLPVAIATLCFYIRYRLAEDYLFVPRIMARPSGYPAWSPWSPSWSAAP